MKLVDVGEFVGNSLTVGYPGKISGGSARDMQTGLWGG
jgi:hypothetical protein